jgi:hypothetical protein
MPRKEYKTITVKIDTFQRFVKTVKDAKKDDPSLGYSEFLDSLLNSRKKSK